MKKPDEVVTADQRSRGKKAAATRAAILDSARRAFIRAGYDGVGVREIAQGANVTAMLVNHYFGSKQRLFEEVVDETLSRPGILTRNVTGGEGDIARLTHDMAAALVASTIPAHTPLDGFAIMLKSASSPEAVGILRDKFVAHFSDPLTALLPGDEAQENAALILAVIAGVQLMRQIIHLPGIADADNDRLVRKLEAVLQTLTDATG